jgi:hypothetical protein
MIQLIDLLETQDIRIQNGKEYIILSKENEKYYLQPNGKEKVEVDKEHIEDILLQEWLIVRRNFLRR